MAGWWGGGGRQGERGEGREEGAGKVRMAPTCGDRKGADKGKAGAFLSCLLQDHKTEKGPRGGGWWGSGAWRRGGGGGVRQVGGGKHFWSG